MSRLQQLHLEENPISCSRLYRMDVLACFPEAQGVVLDGKPTRRSEKEMAALRASVSACKCVYHAQCCEALHIRHGAVVSVHGFQIG
jgi:hypothetical protein